ncbi:MAG TPA: YraN family protein [Chloroflexota bacterium]|jgi:putative endonuclease
MSISDSQLVGRLGEMLAEAHLRGLGAHILERNYRSDGAEVDLLMLHEGDLVAVEVKTRAETDLEKPEEAITWWQLRRIVHGLAAYAAEAELLDLHWRVDLLAIETDLFGNVQRLEHMRDIYPP